MATKIFFLLMLHQITCQLSPNDLLDKMANSYAQATNRAARFLPYRLYDNPQSIYGQTPMSDEETFDFIVVGSGSAGAVVANRLSEVPDWRVLLLEVGEEPTVLTDIPAIAPVFQFTNYNWGYLMEKQANMCLGLQEERMAWPRGRALGGSTIINYMIHVRGNKIDYDRWAAMGNPGWSYDEVLPYFKKSEDFRVNYQDRDYHHLGGPLTVEDVPHRSESVRAFIQGAQEMGHKLTDYNGHDQMGVSFVHATTRRGKRLSAEKAYLRPCLNRRNLKILTKSRAVKVLIDPETKRTYGVQYVRNRRYWTARASKEVILSAGAFNSPQLLMLSGIGPKGHLQDLGIPLVQDLPVGQKLYDHLTFLGLAFTANESIVNQQRDLENPSAFLTLLLDGKGPLTTLGGVEALLYMRSNVSKDPDPNYPDMELIFVGGSFNTDKGLVYRKSFRLKDEVYDKVWRPLEGKYVWSVLPMLIHPKSYGYLKLKSKNPYHWPKFYGNFFTDPEGQDIKTFIAAIREVQRIARSPALRRYNTQMVRTPIPGCEGPEFDSDQYWECALRHVTGTLHHQVATCKMGPNHDNEAVVDPKLKVYGVHNLRVADTSVIPLPLAAHTNIPAFMVGEKAADLIKEEWMLKDNLIQTKDIRRHAL